MNAEDVLVTTAEVGIGLAGFSGIVAAVIGTRAAARWSREQRFRLTELLRTSFGAVVFSLFPLILISAGVRNSTAWLVTSLTWLVYVVLAVAVQGRALRSIRAEPSAERWSVIAVSALAISMVATISLQLCNVLFLRTGWPHLVAILGGLIAGFVMFVRLLFHLWEEEGRAA